MKALIFLAVVVLCSAVELKPLTEKFLAQYNAVAAENPNEELSAAGTYRFNPMTMNVVDQRFAQSRRQNTINDVSDELSKMRSAIYNRREPIAERQNPVLEPLLRDVAKSMKRVNKRVTKQGDLPHAKENMEMFSKLLNSIHHMNKRLDPKPAKFTDQKEALRNKEIQQLLYIPQPQEENEEQQAMHERSHAQSRTIHQMLHAIDRLALNTQSDMDRKMKYDHALNEVMHQHLRDPRYHDSLHDHLAAHHLASPHSDAEFNEHLSQHLLYHDVGRVAENDFLHSAPQATARDAPLPWTQGMIDAQKKLA